MSTPTTKAGRTLERIVRNHDRQSTSGEHLFDEHCPMCVATPDTGELDVERNPCPTCSGTGTLTDEAVRTHSEGWPSGKAPVPKTGDVCKARGGSIPSPSANGRVAEWQGSGPLSRSPRQGQGFDPPPVRHADRGDSE